MTDDVEFLGFNVPTPLAVAFRREVARRMTSQSALLREALAKELGMWPLVLPEIETIVSATAHDERPSTSSD